MRFLLFAALSLTFGLKCKADTNGTFLFLIPDQIRNGTVIQSIKFEDTNEMGSLNVSSDDKSMRAKEEYILIVPDWEAKNKGIETLDNLISMVEDYSVDVNIGPVSVETHEKKRTEEIHREIPVDIDSLPQEDMEVEYDFNTNQYRRPTRN